MIKRISLFVLLAALLLVACAPRPMEAAQSIWPGGVVTKDMYAEVETVPMPLVDEGMGYELASLPSPSVERMVIKNASLSIVVTDPAQSMEAIAQMADNMGGFVVSSYLYQTRLESGKEVPQASITIRVPAEKLQVALEQIKSGAGRVLNENISGQDVTQEYTDMESRLRNLEQAEAQLREIMASATKTADVLQVYSELIRVREQIEVIKGQMQYYEQAAALSAISVELIADAAVQPLTIGGWQPVGVAKDAIQTLINTLKFLANVVIWLVLYVLPVVLVLFFPVRGLWRLVQRWRRQRREAKAQAAEKGKTS
ncbi:MAG: DUF4349 domain-containing protein [Chloroflexota bacterium]